MYGYTDDEILAKLKSPNKRHNDEALFYIYEQYFQVVANYITKNNGIEKDAEDTFQNAIIILFNQVKEGDLKLTVSLKTYLFSIARNIWLKALRKQKKAVPLTEEHEYIVFEDDNLTAELEFDEMIQAIKTMIAHLGKDCREILRYFYLERIRIKEIMTLLDYKSIQSVKNKKWRCIIKLKEKLRQNHLFNDFF